MIYEIPGQLATLNEHDYANRSSKWTGRDHKETQTQYVGYKVKQGQKIDKPVIAHFTWYHSGKHDYDNIAFAKKYVLDGMVEAGILPNDNQTWVKGFTDSFVKVKPGQEKVVVKMEIVNAKSKSA